MVEQTKNAPAAEVKPAADAIPPASTEQEKKPDTEKVETVGDLLDTKPSSKKEDTSVPLATHLALKNEKKALEREMKELKKSIEDGATKKEVSSDIKAIAEKHGIDADLLEDIAQTARAEARKEVDDEFKPLKAKEREEKIDRVFNEHFAKALEQAPEFKDIVNKETIKALSLNPANANKTFIQLIEDSYGHLVQGKRSIDSGQPRANKDDSQEVDVARAKRDSGYFKEVMANPAMKKKYNERLTSGLFSHL